MSSLSRVIVSLVCIFLVLLPSRVRAEEVDTNNDKVSTVVTKGNKAPFSGILLTVKLASEMKANCDPQNIDKRIKIEREEATNLCQSQCKTQIDILNGKLSAAQEKHIEVVAAKDKEIADLRIMLSSSSWYTNPKLWFGVGIVVGATGVVVIAKNL